MPPETNSELADARRLLDLLGEGDPHTFQWFDDTKQTGASGIAHGHLEDIQDVLKSHNSNNCGIYFMVNAGDGKGRRTENVTGVRALFVDIDGTPLQPVRDAPIAPHALVRSGTANYHAYWLVKDCPLDRFSILQKAMAKRFGSDSSVSGIPHVLRVPGFYNCKTKHGGRFMVELLEIDPSLPHSVDTLVKAFGLAKLEAEEIKKAKAPLPELDTLKPKSIPLGDRHETLCRYAWHFALQNNSRFQMLATLRTINEQFCCEPKADREIVDIVDSALEKVPHVDLRGFLTAMTDKAPPEADDVFCDDKPEEESGAATTFALPEDLLLSAPGLTGEIANWLNETNFYWQPSYSLAGALSFVGMLKGHNVCTQENSRTNLLTIAVGPSSSGKTVPLKRLQLLARSAGLANRLCGEPVSEQGLVKGLIDAGHKAFIPWDEIGLAFKGMFSTYAPNYKAGIVRLILKLYSMADETVLGFQYASADPKTPRTDLHEPCLCLYGTTTREGIFGAFSSVEAVNGFAARLLIFETHDYLAERQPVGVVTPPEDLIFKVRQVSGEDRPPDPSQGNLTGVMTRPVAKVVPYSAEARQVLKAAGRQFESLKNAAIKGRRPAEESIWGRAYEQSTKVALTVEDGDEISEESAQWAVTLITTLCRNMVIAARDQIADNQTHAELNSVLKLIREAHPKWVDSTYLCRKTRNLPLKKRKELLASLVEEGTVEAKQSTTNGRAKTLFRYLR